MKLGQRMIAASLKHPKLVVWLMVLVTIALGALMVRVQVDTDPENMLADNEAVRVFHHQVKKEFSLYDIVVLGVVNEVHPDGVFNQQTLARVHELTEFIRTLTWDDPQNPGHRIGVVKSDLIAPGNVDSIEQGGLGQVRFAWLMSQPPQSREEALHIRDLARANPLLNGTLVSEDGKALCLYIPITSKDLAYRVQKELQAEIAGFAGDEQYHITGLPVAEDTFGVEMFIQMAISAPVAMLLIFLLLLFFFRKLKLILAPMIIAMVSVICTMGLLIGTGHTLHIMSSMIPIFLMPIAVVDSIHILSEFFDEYQKVKDRRKTIVFVVSQLFMPMLYTSLTSAAGFLSLALTPIPPVRVFGLFVAFGIMLAWVLTIVFVPAYVMLMSEESLKNFGAPSSPDAVPHDNLIARHLRWLSGKTYHQAKTILVLSLIALAVAGYGITKIQINDNPVKWFTKKHPIRVADRVLNQHFGGTYEAYLVLEGGSQQETVAGMSETLAKTLAERLQTVGNGAAVLATAREQLAVLAAQAANPDALITSLVDAGERQLDQADDDSYDAWLIVLDVVENQQQRHEIFKRPEVLRYVAALQERLAASGTVGKSNSVVDVVKKVHQELYAGQSEQFRVPDSSAAVAQCLISFQNSHKPADLWHLITPDFAKANLWVQLRSGDNQEMEKVVAMVEEFFAANPPPVELQHRWAGLTYLNVVWQDKMVSGMLNSLLGSFVVVLVMMVFLFRSLIWGLVAMVPLTLTIALIYGIIGLVGKDYDMPVAVLSSLTLGMAVDFAIHFLERSRMAYKKTGSWQAASRAMFEEPARAISRNVIVIAIGFTPLLLAPLMPYKTVGLFLASIMAISGLATMIIIPSLLTLLQNVMFRKLS
ncbi:MAG: MMPL family transporter [Deltaproteobacteria bacterium]|nr:MMPL family transporter [Candidatus Anaeroferrophillus wilburensis]MBN2887820.1 MMPL family transporter [Deltaproteobacteria bacterium]